MIRLDLTRLASILITLVVLSFGPLQDLGAQTLECPPGIITVSCPDDIVAGTATLSASGDCVPDPALVMVTGPVVDTNDDGDEVHTFTFSYPDDGGDCTMAPTCTQVFILDCDFSITAPADATVACFEEIASGTAIVTGGCADTEVTVTMPSDGADCDGATFVVTYSADSPCALPGTVSAMQTFTIARDALSIAVPAGGEVACDDEIPTAPVEVTGSCNDVGTWVITGPTLRLGTDTCPGAEYDVVYSYTDDCDRTVEETVTYTIADDPDPLYDWPTDIEVSCATDVVAGIRTITELCSEDIEGVAGLPVVTGGTEACPTVLTITYTFTDGTCGRDIPDFVETYTIVPPEEPITISCPADEVVACADDVEASTAIGATSECGLDLTVVAGDPVLTAGTAECPEEYTITYTVTDECENEKTCTQIFTIDIAEPSIMADDCPADETVTCAAEVEAVDVTTVVFTTGCDLGAEVTAGDPVAGDDNSECGNTDGDTYTITYTVTDDCGNTATCDQVFTIVNAGMVPSFDCPVGGDVECAADIDVDALIDEIVVTKVCDAVDGSFDVSDAFIVGTPDCNGTTYTYSVVYTDNCGISSTSDCNIVFTIVNDGPTITCPADVETNTMDDVVADTDAAIVEAACELGYTVTAVGPTLIDGTGITGCNGMYEIVYTVTDDCGGTAECTQTFTLTSFTCEAEEITAATCNNADGEAEVSALIGGVAPFSFLWSDGQTTQAATGLAAGMYTVIVTDDNGCESECSVTVGLSDGTLCTIGSNGPICEGDDLMLTSSPAGGTYSWTGPGGFTSTDQNPVVSPGVAGTYEVEVTGADGCVTTCMIEVEVNPLPVITIAETDPTACGADDGEITIGGLTAGESYIIEYLGGIGSPPTSSAVLVSSSGSIIITGLAPGSYTGITVTDNNGCTSEESTAELIDPDAPAITVVGADPTACGESDGMITISGLDASSNYTLNYMGAAGMPVSGAVTSDAAGNIIITALPAGIYTNIFVTDAAGCMTANFEITLGSDEGETCTAENSSPVCIGDPLTLFATPDGGTYSWTGPGGFTSTDQNPFFGPAVAGTYIVTVINAEGCESVCQTIVDVEDCGSAMDFVDIVDPCLCIGDGEFASTVKLTASSPFGWSLVNVVGVTDPITGSPVPSGPIPSGVGGTPTDPWVAAGSNYCLTVPFVHTGANNFSFQVTNGTQTFSFPNDFISAYAGCTYPDATINGDQYICLNSGTANYFAPLQSGAMYTWTLNGATGAPITVAGALGQTANIDWTGFTGGPHDVCLTVARAGGCVTTNCLEVFIEEVTPLACNNIVNLSMDSDCEVEIWADMILEDPPYPNGSYHIVLTCEETGEILPDNVVTAQYVGKLLKVEVVHSCSGNSCWGQLMVEDKIIPPLNCDDLIVDCDDNITPGAGGFPLPVSSTTTVQNNGDGSFTLNGFDDCGSATLTFEDVIDQQACTDDYGSIVTRTYTVTDGSGRASVCIQKIYVRPADIADVIFPPHFDINNVLECGDKDVPGGWTSFPDGSTDKDGNDISGHPSTSTTGTPVGIQCGNLQAGFTDRRYDDCSAGSFKIERSWKVLDWCTGASRFHTQIIKVVDFDRPICIAPDEFDVYTVSGELHNTCMTSFKVPPPVTIEDCSSTTVRVGYKTKREGENPFIDFTLDGVTGPDADGFYTIPPTDFPEGQIWIIYIVEDACGNVCQAFTEATVIDQAEPVAVCDQLTKVSIGVNGEGWANAYAFSDGSYDDCSEVTLQVRRTDDGPTCGETHIFRDAVKFCCSDIGKRIPVEVLVTDASGNTSACWVEAEVQSNFPTIIESCPDDVTVQCGTDLTDLSAYGSPTYGRGCDNLDPEVTRNIDDCGIGTITRVFRGTDAWGNLTSCTQTITVERDPFTENDIDFPADTEVVGCSDYGVPPENLPYAVQRPRFPEKGCHNVLSTYEDLTLPEFGDHCRKIFRTWTVIDWCQYNRTTGAGYWQQTQIIKVKDDDAPVITSDCINLTFDSGDNVDCSGAVNITMSATDNCTAPEDLNWGWSVDADVDGDIDFTGGGASFVRNLDVGEYELTWTVEDECGNITSCTHLIWVTDAGAPTPYCITLLTTTFNADTDDIEIWASDFALNPSDNCSGEIQYSFSPDVNDKSRTFTCGGFVKGEQNIQAVQVYFTDASGNQAYCDAKLVIQDNNGVCDNDADTDEAMISGLIFTEHDEMVSDVDVSLMANMPNYPANMMTSSDGKYAFETVMHEDYSVEPSKNIGFAEGVTTLDLVLIQRHILGIQDITSPYSIIAADINNSQSLTATDIVQLRRMILEIDTEYPENESWRFVDASQTFVNPQNPWPFTESISVQDLNINETDKDFVGVKIGDVDGSYQDAAQSIEVRSDASVKLTTKNQMFTAADKVELAWTMEDARDLVGMQMTLQIDTDLVSFDEIKSEAISIDDENISLVDIDRGIIRISWDNAASIAQDNNTVLFSILLDAEKSGRVSQAIALSTKTMNPEMYVQTGNEIETQTIELEFTNTSIAEGEFVLYQNIPNPFSQKTEISFQLTQKEAVTLRVYDTTGKLLKTVVGIYEKGLNAIELDLTNVDIDGLLYYHLETVTHTANKKMILIR